MSTNNQLIILKSKEGIEVHENMCVDNDFTPNNSTLLKSCKTLKESIKFANKYCSEYPYVEYGYHICDDCLK